MKIVETVKGIVYRKGERNNFLLLKTIEDNVWQFVTGRIESGESEKEAMKRELKEEASIGKEDVIKINKLDFKDSFTAGNHKIVSAIFLIEVKNNTDVDITNNPEEKEHVDFSWNSSKEVKKKLEFDNQIEFFEKALSILK